MRGAGGGRNAEAGGDEKPAIDVWGFFIPACLQELTHTLYLDALCLVKGEIKIALFQIPEKFVLGQV